MKKNKELLLFMALLALAVASTAAAADAERSPDAQTLVRKADEIMDLGSSTMEVEMRVFEKGEERKFYGMTMHTKGADKILIVFSKPAREKGRAFLSTPDGMWLFLPNNHKILRLPGRDSFSGTDFSNHDVLDVNLLEDYNAVLLGTEDYEGRPAYLLELTARGKTTIYAKIKYWIAVDNNMPLQRQFFTGSGRLLKTLKLSTSPGSKFARPDVWEMWNELNKKRKSVMIYIELKNNQAHPDSMFTRNYLKRLGR
jgi:outer membrane lipoprotein-sorting protein